MKIIEIINEEINDFHLNEESVWYHGTPDSREVKQTGGFTQRTNTTDYISNPKKWRELQHEMQIARNTGKEDLYFNLLDQVGKLRKQMTYKKPIFFTDNYNVANTYANPQRAFDYQGSIPKTMTVNINDNGKILKVPAYGERFGDISVDIIKNALIKAGVNENEIKKYFDMFQTNIHNNKMSTDTLAIITQLLGYDIVDVQGVLDSYQGGVTKSTVRMVFDPKRINIIK